MEGVRGVKFILTEVDQVRHLGLIGVVVCLGTLVENSNIKKVMLLFISEPETATELP